ncbi:MAG: prepilin-type N-terminal cleavage/methylation domain-containing protein [Burkholderiaceae bacterium]|nr:MAG: prepilin-type N-terminal cleavage/methylation domain-containing protein [Burkholderiaceae bacterium]
MTRRARRGFTLIELMVTLAIMAMLLMIAVPAVGRAIQNARTSSLVHRLPQDMAWARNRSATGPLPYRIVLGPGCQWRAQQAAFGAGGTLSWGTNAETAVRSLDAATAAAQYPGATCTLSGAGTQTITFDHQGQIADNAPTVRIASGNGQTWVLQVLLSGLVLLNAGTSS